MTDIKVPELGESVSEATVGRWLKSKGDTVQRDDVLVELETDKVAIEVAAEESGVLTEIISPEGETVEIGALLGRIGIGAAAPADNTASETDNNADQVEDSEPSSAPAVAPSARRIAAEAGISPNTISGTGRGGRVTKSDALSHVAEMELPAGTPNGESAAAPSAPKPPAPPAQPVAAVSEVPVPETGSRLEERVRMTRLRQTIARRLKEAQNTAAMLTTFNDLDMSRVMELRKTYRDSFLHRHGVKLGFMGFFTHACIGALRRFPAVNARIEGDDIVYHRYYDVSIAVGTERGLVTPVVRNADTLDLAGIEREIARLGGLARDGQIQLNDIRGGTFTITNGGVYGSMLSTPIVNPPQSAVLGIHRIEERPVAVDGAVVIRPMMYLALSYDHRIIDGKEAVSFLVAVKDAMESPERMLLGL